MVTKACMGLQLECTYKYIAMVQKLITAFMEIYAMHIYYIAIAIHMTMHT